MASSAGAANAMDPDTDLYGLLHVPRDASDEEIKRAYRNFAQIYHPDKYQSPQMQDVAKEQFNRVRDAYEILSDEGKRQVYDIYGMEGLRSGLEIGEHLKSKEEIRDEFERAQIRQSERRLRSRLHQTGAMVVSIGVNELWENRDARRDFGGKAYGAPPPAGIWAAALGQQINGRSTPPPKRWPPITDMAIHSTVQAPMSDKNVLVFGGNIAARRGLGGGNVMLVFKRQCSSNSSWEIISTAGLRPSLGAQVNRQLSQHASGAFSCTMNLMDGSMILSNSIQRQLTTHTTGQLAYTLGSESGVSVGWHRRHERSSVNGDLRVGTSTFGLSASYSRHFSAVSQGRLSGKLGSSGVELEVGGSRRISDNSSAGMFCTIGLQGILWKLRYTRGGQKFIIPLVLSSTLNPYMAVGALIIPCSVYVLLKAYVLKPYAAKRKQRKLILSRKENAAKVREARKSAKGAQSLMENVAKRKRAKEEEREGLVILDAVYGNLKEWEKDPNHPWMAEEDDEEAVPPSWIDVTLPLQFLIDNNGELHLHDGIRKAGLMGFCDSCPGEEKQLRLRYLYGKRIHEVIVEDRGEVHLPQRAHRLPESEEENADNDQV